MKILLVVYMDKKIKGELIKRYKYLYENKEIILSLTINKGIEKQAIKECLTSLKRLLKNTNSNDIKELIKDGIISCKEQLKEPKYYLFKDIDGSLIDIFFEFLFTDLDIVDTELYKKIEMIKNDSKLYDQCMMKINGLLDRRKNNRFLRDNNPFTVWKILTYVRNNNIGNKSVLDALDKYYNIDRYIITGVNFNSGYIFLESDEKVYNECITKLPYNMIFGGVRTAYEFSGIMTRYEGNEFECEDDYFAYSWIENINYKINEDGVITNFLLELINMEDLSLEEKEEVYKDLVLGDYKKLKREIH